MRRSLSCLVSTLLALLPTVVMADYRGDIGHTKLQQELGAATPDGTGIRVTQVEGNELVNGQDAWFPDPAHTEFVGKTISNASGAASGLYSSHATSVGGSFYGNARSIAPGVSNISAFSASDWMGGGALLTVIGSGGSRPLSSTSRVANHSYVGSAPGAESYVLRRVDWLVETDEYLQVVGLGNGAGDSYVAMLGSAYNVIATGRTDGQTRVGSVALDETYTAGRTRPDLVDPSDYTSTAAPRIASAVALLVQAGHDNPAWSSDPVTTSMTNRAGILVRNAERSEVIKAALMAGADRVTHDSTSINLLNYRAGSAERTSNGLDRRYGAGQLNVRNSYWILAGGEQGSAEDGNNASHVGSRGFDYDPYFGGAAGSNSTATYPLPVETKPRLLTAALVWNLDINGGTANNFNPAATLHDLNIEVIDMGAAGTPVVAASLSAIENTENIWMVVPAGAQYALRVTRTGSFRWDYGLAWQLLDDTDGDGAHDGQDNCIDAANGPLLPDAGGNSQLDSDGDGYGNMCDGDLDNSGGIVNFADLAAFKAMFGTPNANGDLNGSGGIVNFADLARFKALFGKPPGASGIRP
ncbi:MAG: hypothetical protein R3F27_01995 [Gammaproteobacteria bacterium]